MLTVEDLKAQFDLSQDGVFTRKSTGKVYDEANDGRDEYITIRISGKMYKAHRLVWLWHHGVFPSKDLDHINRIKTCNGISNLREVSSRQNSQNRTDQSGLGCGVRPNGTGFQAKAKHECKNISLGAYSIPELARLAYALFVAHGIISELPDKYTGVTFHRASKKWRAQTRAPQKQIGYFATEQEALAAIKEYYSK